MSPAAIDMFCHCLPSAYCEAVERAAAPTPLMFSRARAIAVMADLDARLRLMDRFPGYRQVLSLASPALEALAPPGTTPDLARVANDAMATMVTEHGDRFPGFVASLPMNDVDAALREAQRAVDELGASGVQVYTNVSGHPLDEPRYLQLFELMAAMGRPVWLHPIRPMTAADYRTETVSRYDIWWSLGWPYETSVAMCRLVFAGVFDRWPALVVITHHVGGVIAMMEGRLGSGMELLGTRNPPEHAEAVATRLKEAPLDALRRFRADTASFGSRAAIECGRAFFGVDHLVFATDMPFDPEGGPAYIRSTLAAIEAMELSAEERGKILHGNAERLLKVAPAGGAA